MRPEALKDLYERQLRALERHPSFGRASVGARAHLGSGALAVEEGARVLHVDLAAEDGGDDRDPNPAQLMRASLAAALASSYKVWGARLGIPVDEVLVDVVCEHDARGPMGMTADVPVGWERVLFDVQLTSDAAEAQVRALVAHADRLNPMLANLSGSIVRVHRLTIRGTK